MSRAALKVENLSVSLGSGRRQLPVVDRVSFEIQPGEAIGLVGESGCGKTMTAMAIMGLLPADAVSNCDQITLNGKDLSFLTGKQKRSVLGRDIAMIFQQPGTALDPVFTIGQQVGAVYKRHNHVSRERTRRAVLKTLHGVGFDQPEEVSAAYPHLLSGGMRQLAMIAMAMVCEPAVVIADEPSTALDAGVRTLVLQQLEKLRAHNNTALLLISHDLMTVRLSCSHMMVMYCGRIIESGQCDDLFNTPRHPYTAGLLGCIPTLDGDEPLDVKAIPGQVPAFNALPSGCHFAPRCGRVADRCEVSAPQLEADSKHRVACLRPLP